MAHRITRHRSLTVKGLTRFLAAQFNILIRNMQLLFGITSNTLVRSSQSYPGRPAALPTATGWDKELRARTAGVRLPRVIKWSK